MSTETIDTTPEVDTARVGYIDGLRQLADLLEQHDALPLPYHGHMTPLTMHFLSAENPRADLAAALRALPGKWDKVDGDTYLDVAGTLAGLKVSLTAFRSDVCERVVTGVETVTETVPDPEALAAVPTVEVTREIEKVKWVCHPILAEVTA